MPTNGFLKPLPLRQIRPTEFQDFAAKNVTDRQACLQYKNPFFFHTTTDRSHLSDDQVKAPTLEDFKRLIATPSTI